MKRFTSIFILITMMMLVFTVSLSAKSQKIRGKSKVDLRSANLYLQSQKFEKALGLYLKVIEETPDNVESLKNIADIHFKFGMEPEEGMIPLNEFKESAVYYQKVKAVFDSIPDWREYNGFEDIYKDTNLKLRSIWAKIFIIGQNELSEDRINESEAIFEDLLLFAPDSIKTYMMLAMIEEKKGDKEKQMKYFSRILEKNPNNEQVIEIMANNFYEKAEYDKAAEYYIRLTVLNPTKVDNFSYAAFSYYNLKDYTKSLEYFEKVYEIDPNNVEAIANAASIAQTLKNDEKSKKYLILAFEKEPSKENAAAIVIYLSGKNLWDDAIKYAEKWYELDKSNKDAVQMLLYFADKANNKTIKAKYQKIFNDLNK